MKKCLKYMKSFTLGFLVLLLFSNSTFAYSIDYHFCQDEIKSVTFFGKKASCSTMIEANLGSCCDKKVIPSSEESITKKSCCSNEQLQNSSVLQKKVDSEPAFLSSVFAILPTEFSIALSVNLDVSLDEFKIAHPPSLYWTNHQSRLQVFLI